MILARYLAFAAVTARGFSFLMPPSTRNTRAAKRPAASGDSATKRAKKKTVVEPPEDWRATWDMIVELRHDRSAVVDSMGSEALADKTVDEATFQYQTLVSLMLSSQTKDITTAETMRALRKHGLNVDNILRTSDEDLNDLIKKVGFHNNKTRFIKEATRLLRDDHDSKVPDTMDALCALPGVGPKMALIVLRVAHGITAGVAVDTHVHRICNQLAWVGPKPTKTPEHTRAAVESWLPTDLWDIFNLILVGLGQELQTEKPKLLAKCLKSSNPRLALETVQTLGMDVAKVADKHAADLQVLSGLGSDEIQARLRVEEPSSL